MTAILPASVGPATTLVEAVAASVGAGIVLGGFAMGAVGILTGWSRRDFEKRMLRDGYLGGIAGAVALVVDLVLRYGW